MNSSPIPPALRTWFVVHFIADMISGIPLLFFPELVMPLLGWTPLDPIATRVVGAALMGIGIESYLGRNAPVEVYRAMLNLKIIWATSAVIGIALGIYHGGAPAGWVFLVVFAVFWFVWVYYWRKLNREPR